MARRSQSPPACQFNCTLTASHPETRGAKRSELDAGNLRAYIHGQDDRGTRRWRTDRPGPRLGGRSSPEVWCSFSRAAALWTAAWTEALNRPAHPGPYGSSSRVLESV